MATFIHDTAEIAASAVLGENVKIWNWAQIRERARIGANTIISKSVYIDSDVEIGENCKIQNNVSIYHGVTVERGVFIGPHVCFTNDRIPRAINSDGSLKSLADWVVTPIRVLQGASIGANSTILPGITLGRFCLIGSGSVVTHDVPEFALVVGNPARQIGTVCFCGHRAEVGQPCPKCGFTFE